LQRKTKKKDEFVDISIQQGRNERKGNQTEHAIDKLTIKNDRKINNKREQKTAVLIIIPPLIDHSNIAEKEIQVNKRILPCCSRKQNGDIIESKT
jgi:hypothetical protein